MAAKTLVRIDSSLLERSRTGRETEHSADPGPPADDPEVRRWVDSMSTSSPVVSGVIEIDTGPIPLQP